MHIFCLIKCLGVPCFCIIKKREQHNSRYVVISHGVFASGFFYMALNDQPELFHFPSVLAARRDDIHTGGVNTGMS